MKANSLFHSCFKLKLKNQKIEEIFQKELLEKGGKYSDYMLGINTIFLVSTIAISATFRKTQKEEFQDELCLIFWILIVFSFLLVTVIILRVALRKNLTMRKINIFLNYFIFSCIFLLARYIFLYSELSNELIHVIFYLDLLIKFIMLEVSLIDFWDNFITNVILIIATKIIHGFLFKWKYKAVIYMSIGDVLRVTLIVFAFFILRKKRKIIYYLNTLSETNHWYKNVLDNINSGFVKITNNQITFLNNCILEISKKKNHIPYVTNDAEGLKEINHIVLNDIATYTHLLPLPIDKNMPYITIKTENSNTSSTEDVAMSTQGKVDIFLGQLKNVLLQLGKKREEFIYIGTALLNEEDTNNSNFFELYGRYYENEKGENIEMIFNDVTRTKIEQEKNAEIHYKTVLLSKIAHEFKNPLICLTEIVEEELDKIEIKDNNFKMIKSITNYLLILIKDIDSFSQIQYNKSKEDKRDMKLTYSKVNLEEIISFVQMIARYLLTKTHFQNKVKFLVKANGIPSDIITDEIKLKQILINLVSNSIKFTSQGSITLTIEKDQSSKYDDYIKFTVSDTGIGISQENQDELFKSFSKAKNNCGINKYGAGLGLAISSEITKLLGKEMQVKSVPGKGSEFWFSIRLNKDNLNEFDDSSTTIKLSDIALGPTDQKICRCNANLFPTTKSSKEEINLSCRHKTVLIGDDETLIRKAMKRIIMDYGEKNGIMFDIIEANDGIEILSSVFKFYSSSQKKKIDFIISDENMIYLSGKKASIKLKKMERVCNFLHIPFFLSSAYSYQKLEENIDGIIHKPLLYSDLDDIMSKI